MEFKKQVGKLFLMKILSNIFSSFKVGYNQRKNIIFIKKTRLTLTFCEKLYELGYIRGYSLTTNNIYKLGIFLKYFKNEPAFARFKYIFNVKKNSNCKVFDIKKYHITNNIFSLFSTTDGFTTAIDCIVKNKGGFLIFKI